MVYRLMGLKIVPGLRGRKPRSEPMVGPPAPVHPLPPPGDASPRDEAASDSPTDQEKSSDGLTSDAESDKPGGDARGSIASVNQEMMVKDLLV